MLFLLGAIVGAIAVVSIEPVTHAAAKFVDWYCDTVADARESSIDTTQVCGVLHPNGVDFCVREPHADFLASFHRSAYPADLDETTWFDHRRPDPTRDQLYESWQRQLEELER